MNDHVVSEHVISEDKITGHLDVLKTRVKSSSKFLY